MGAVIAYLRTLEPIDHVLPEPEINVPAGVLFSLGLFGDALPAEYIDHQRPIPQMPEIGINEAYGQYLASTMGCTLCHGGESGRGDRAAQRTPRDDSAIAEPDTERRVIDLVAR